MWSGREEESAHLEDLVVDKEVALEDLVVDKEVVRELEVLLEGGEELLAHAPNFGPVT